MIVELSNMCVEYMRKYITARKADTYVWAQPQNDGLVDGWNHDDYSMTDNELDILEELHDILAMEGKDPEREES